MHGEDAFESCQSISRMVSSKWSSAGMHEEARSSPKLAVRILFAVTLLLAEWTRASHAAVLNNGLAQTPPMGWLAWERFRCNVDCKNDPENCISERLFQQMADQMVKDGFRDAGYTYLNIDDCWMAKERNADGQMIADPDRFPSGIKGLAKYAHERGLKLGLYSDIGSKTCEKWPGMAGNLELDAQTFASWDIDYLKVDGCYAAFSAYPTIYPELGRYLNATGRPIVYSCSWPAYYHYMSASEQAKISGYEVPYQKMRDGGCNLWRNWKDISTSWKSIKSIIMYWLDASRNSKGFTEIAGPGSWNDPDMLIIGNKGITIGHARAQMAMWSIFAAPLLMSNDLRSLPEDSKSILLNEEVIAVNQDSDGNQGIPTSCHPNGCHSGQVWKRMLADGSMAVVLLNLQERNLRICATWEELGIPSEATCFVRDLFARQYTGKQRHMLCGVVDPQTAQLYKITSSNSSE